MSKLKTVGVIISSLKIPNQDHEELITFFDIYNGPEKINSALKDDRFDLLGFLPKGFDFKNEKTISRVVETFNQNPEKIAFMIFPCEQSPQECPYFINKKILPIKGPVDTLPDMLLLVKKLGLEAHQSMEEIFIYDNPIY